MKLQDYCNIIIFLTFKKKNYLVIWYPSLKKSLLYQLIDNDDFLQCVSHIILYLKHTFKHILLDSVLRTA